MLEWVDVECIEPEDWDIPRIPTVSWILEHILPILKASKVTSAWLTGFYADGVYDIEESMEIAVDLDQEYEYSKNYLSDMSGNISKALGIYCKVYERYKRTRTIFDSVEAVKIYEREN